MKAHLHRLPVTEPGVSAGDGTSPRSASARRQKRRANGDSDGDSDSAPLTQAAAALKGPFIQRSMSC